MSSISARPAAWTGSTAAEADEVEAAGVSSALAGDGAEGTAHVGVDQQVDAVGRLHFGQVQQPSYVVGDGTCGPTQRLWGSRQPAGAAGLRYPSSTSASVDRGVLAAKLVAGRVRG